MHLPRTRARIAAVSILLSCVALIGWPQSPDLLSAPRAHAQQAEAETDPLLKEYNAVLQLFEDGKYRETIAQGTTLAEKVKARDGERHANYAKVLTAVALGHQGLGHGPQAEALHKRALAIREQLHGKVHIDVAENLKHLADLYRTLARYTEAEQLYRRALAIVETAAGADQSHLAAILNSLALTYQDLGLNRQSESLFRRSLAIHEKLHGPDHIDVAQSLNNLAGLYLRLARYAEAVPLYQRAMAIVEKTLGAEHEILGLMLGNVAQVNIEYGRYAEAETLLRRSAAIREKALGPNHPEIGFIINKLAELYGRMGRYSEAETLFKRALPIIENGLGATHHTVAAVLHNLGRINDLLGRYAEAEAFHRRGLVITEKGLGADHREVAFSLMNVAGIYVTRARRAEAEPLLKRAHAILEKNLGPDHPNVALMLNQLGVTYFGMGRDDEAEASYRRAIAIREKAQGREHPDLVVPLGNLAGVFTRRKRYADAEALYRRSLAIGEKAFGKDHVQLAIPLRELGFVYQELDRAAEGEPLLSRALALQEKALGASHMEVADTLSAFARLKLARNRVSEAVPLTQRALRIVGKALAKDGRLDVSLMRGYFELNIDTLRRARNERLVGPTADALTFEVAQWANQSVAATALGQMAARLGAGNDALAALIREQQDITAHLRVLDKELVAEFAKPANERNQVRENGVRNRIAALERKLRDYNTRIATQFPRHAELVTASPLAVADVQKLLGSDEALLLYHVNDDRSFVWAVTRDRIEWHTVKLSSKFLGQQVETLRAALDIEKNRNLTQTFDYDAAHRLYSAVLGPVEDVIKGKPHLIVVPAGPLASLPFHVLVTEKKAGSADDHRSAAWLVRRHAVTVLPAVASLKALREVAVRASAPQPYLGFGNPIFAPAPGQAAPSPRARLAAVMRGSDTRMDDLRRALPPLPDTADEVRAVARALGTPTQVKLAEDATERAVKNARLADYRILHFATHGLEAGQTGRFIERAEPALALTLPQKPSELDDGLLTASEVAALNLNADWVILSACNTAAGAKAGAEPLSGLARSFFYAGAKTLLVSHWPVQSEAAVRLVTRAIRALEQDRTLTPAEALRRAMLALLEDRSKAENAHPGIWAPFVIVGTTARAR
jgi:CHAT domain-containing protein/Tfp pilus assembly protein PilF